MKDKVEALVVNTKALVENLGLTMNVTEFLESLDKVDAATRWQCLCKARRELGTQRVTALHDPKKVRRGIAALQKAMPNNTMRFNT